MNEQLPPADQPAGEPSADDRNWAMLVHVLTLVTILVGGWFVNLVVPVIGLLWKGQGSTFVRDHSVEELNFQISITIYSIALLAFGFVFGIATLGIGLLVLAPVAILLGIVVLVVMIRAALAASRGEQYRYPLTLRFVN